MTAPNAADMGPLFAAAIRYQDPPFLTNPATELERRFAQFHYANPAVFAEIERKALSLADVEGRTRIGIAEIVEDIRYDVRFMTRPDQYPVHGGKGFKLNNNFRAFYARLLIFRHSRLASVIGTRKQTHYEGAA